MRFFKTTYTEIKIKDIEKINLGQDAPVLLQQIPSLSFSTDAGNGIGYTNLRIRGNDQTRINVSLNGVPYNDAESQGVYWVDIADILSSAKDVQVQRGLGSSTIGAGAFGGNININTSKFNESAYLSLNNSIGSFNSIKNSLLFSSGSINDIFEISGRLTRITSNGFIERALSDLTSGNFNFNIKSKKSLFHLIYFFGDEKTYQAWNGVSEADLLTNRRKNIAGTDFESKAGKPYDNEIDKYTQHNLQAIQSYNWNEHLMTSITLHYTFGSGYYEEYKVGKSLQNYGINNPNSSDLIRQRWLTNHFYGGILQTKFNQNKWSIIGTVSWNQYDGDHYGKVIKTIDVAIDSLPRTYYNNRGIKTDITAFVKIAKEIGRFTPYIDLQVRSIGYTIDGTENELQNLGLKYNTHLFNPKFGLQYKLNQQINMNLYTGFGHKEPERGDFINTPNAAPKVEEMLNSELSIEYKKNQNFASINLYGMWYTNQMILTGAVNDVGNYLRINVPKSYRMGVEGQFNWSLTKKLQLISNLTLSVNKITSFQQTTYTYDENYAVVDSLQLNENLDNKDISFSPALIGYGELNYQINKHWNIGLQNKYVSAQYMDNTQSENKKLSAYNINNATISYTTHFNKVKDVKVFFALEQYIRHRIPEQWLYIQWRKVCR
ncbi:MAG: TonB-dependent receptor plug domain-containing protein [Bacteroidetes bacterium]|nr:TonB-dependent receptor plug domain-containing protein [Bacteroidota bacterium]